MTQWSSLGRVLSVVATVAVLLEACVSGAAQATATKESPTSAAVSQTSSSTASSVPTPPSTASATVPPASASDPTKIVLRLDDLPSAWQQRPAAATGGADSCVDSVTTAGKVFGPDSTAETATAVFSQSEMGPFLGAMVATGLANAESSFAALKDGLMACDGITDAAGFTTSLEPASFPAIGDESFAMQAKVSAPNGDAVSYLLAAARVDDTIVLASNIISLGKLDPGLVEDAIRKMVGRA